MTGELSVILLSSVKFAVTFPYALFVCKLGYWQTVLWTNLGGISGILVFTYLSKQVLGFWNRVMHSAMQDLRMQTSRKAHRLFNKKNRRIIVIRQKYGLPGIIITTPIILSIPLGVFLLTRYYGKKKTNLAYMALSVFAWSLVYASLYTLIADYLQGR